MKSWPTILIVLLVAFAAAGCGSAPSVPPAAPAAGSPASTPVPASVPASAATLDTTYEGALPLRNQLLLGTLNLEESNVPITAEQAATLLPLWQG